MPDIYIVYIECEDGSHMEFIYLDLEAANKMFQFSIREASLVKSTVITLYSTRLSRDGKEVEMDDIILEWEAKSVTTYFYDQGEITIDRREKNG